MPQSTPESVQFSSRALIANEMLKDLSQNVGIKMAAGPTVKNDVLVISCHGEPLAELRQKIAEATEGYWHQVGDTFVLDRSPEVEAAQKKRYVDQVEGFLRADLAPYFQNLDKPLTAQSISAMMDARIAQSSAGRGFDPSVEREGPLARLVGRCLSQINLREVAALPVLEGITYASTPNELQQPIGEKAAKALADFVADQVVWGKTVPAEFARRKLPDQKLFEIFDYTGSDFSDYSFGGAWGFHKAVTAPIKVIISFYHRYDDHFEMTINVLDLEGNEVATDRQEVYAWLDRGPPVEKSVKAEPMMLSAELQALEAFSGSDQRWSGTLTVPDAIRSYYLDPVRNDPVGLLVSECLQEYAKRKKKSLVALLADETTMWVAEGEEFDLAAFMSDMREDEEVVETADWVTIRPRSPYEARVYRADRYRLKSLAERLAAMGAPSIEWYAELQGLHESMSRWSYQYSLGQALAGDKRVQDMACQAFTRFYGSLTDAQRSSLAAGSALTASDLTKEQLRMAWTAFEYTVTNIGVSYGVKGVDYPNAPSESLQGRFPGEFRVTARHEVQTRYLFQDPAQNFATLWSSNVTEAESRGFFSGPPPRQPKNGFDTLVYKKETSRNIFLQIEPRPGFIKTAQFSEEGILAPEPPVSFAELPPLVQPRLKKDLDFYKQLSGYQ